MQSQQTSHNTKMHMSRNMFAMLGSRFDVVFTVQSTRVLSVHLAIHCSMTGDVLLLALKGVVELIRFGCDCSQD